MTPSFEKSKQLNQVLLKEFEVLHSQKNETDIPENKLLSNEDNTMLVTDEGLSENDEEYDESLDNDIIEQSDKFQANDENLQLDEVDKGHKENHEKISEPEPYNESLEDGFENTEQLLENNKGEKELLVNFFSHLDKGITLEEIKPKVPRVGEKKHKCEFCNKPFDGLWKKKRHEKTHTKDEKVSNSKNCEFCKKSFKSHSDMKRHERIHTGERPFKCNICQARFSDKGALKGHEIVHTGAKPFQCKICGKCFVKTQTLKTHAVTQHAKNKEIPNIDVE